MEKGIEVSNLFNSKVFSYDFDFQNWPTIHQNNEEMIKPYNGSIF